MRIGVVQFCGAAHGRYRFIAPALTVECAGELLVEQGPLRRHCDGGLRDSFCLTETIEPQQQLGNMAANRRISRLEVSNPASRLHRLCVALPIRQEVAESGQQAGIVRRQGQALADRSFCLIEAVQAEQQTGQVGVDRQILRAEFGNSAGGLQCLVMPLLLRQKVAEAVEQAGVIRRQRESSTNFAFCLLGSIEAQQQMGQLTPTGRILRVQIDDTPNRFERLLRPSLCDQDVTQNADQAGVVRSSVSALRISRSASSKRLSRSSSWAT